MHYSVDGLCYQLFEGKIDVAPLRILASRQRRWIGGEATFVALGTSHAVCLQTPTGYLTELLTCTPARLTHHVPLLQCGLTQPYHLQNSDAGLEIDIRLEPFDLVQADTLKDAYPEEDTLTVAYPLCTANEQPQQNIEEMLLPLTRIGWRICDNELHVETIHTYPEEGRGARTHTIYRLVHTPDTELT